MKYESNNFQFEAEMPWESAGEGIVRQIMGYNDNLMMVKVKFETGAIGTPHTHPHTQTTYVASGSSSRRTVKRRLCVRATAYI